MHIEPGVVDGAKMYLSYATAAGSAGIALKLAADDLKSHSLPSFVARAVLATVGTFICFEILPHFAVGVSEVHLILGTTLLLILGAGPAAVGLAAGLLVQGLFFAPSDLPMFTVNVTTLLFPLFLVHALARRIIPAHQPYVDLGYAEVLKLSFAFQGGIVAWVAFWALYGQGASVLGDVASFGAAYMLVVIVEPLADLAALAGAKALRGLQGRGIVVNRLHNPA
ncbi:energy-coupling factor ABC transporter permease [Rubrimonas cliftonensis]|uniref:Cobalt uptake substrate-specific transmembrane region n=1 Tax=Rubrimonas cliftonensis TaxID=89524 RepID=A0A1H4FWV0_9RHOB|nr:energy-coupling factor ABC transporter permease [Rubrimonas cliftonensis]SEB01819.1 Cobalt uptake substrate-specific transmembrane region [Rubrimonas cliftonensis]